MRFNRALRLEDIAGGAGTSISTVSRYFRGIKVRPDAQKKIENYLRSRDLSGYIQKTSSQETPAGKKLIGLIVPDMTSYTFSDRFPPAICTRD